MERAGPECPEFMTWDSRCFTISAFREHLILECRHVHAVLHHTLPVSGKRSSTRVPTPG